MSSVYEPSDDTFLLADMLRKEIEDIVKHPDYVPKTTKTTKVKKVFSGPQSQVAVGALSVLDMGAGTGYIGDIAKDIGCDVTYVDVNQDAINYIKSKDNSSKALKSDLFERVKKKPYDILVFNTPYLPDEEDGKIHDIALHGGPRGNEVALKFLKHINNHINEDSVVLMLVSSLGHPEEIESFLKSHSFSFSVVAKKKLSFEELLVYRIQRLDNTTNLSKEEINRLLALLPDKFINLNLVAKGKRGVVFKADMHDSEGLRSVAIKMPLHCSSAHSTVLLEAKHLQTANKLRTGPKYIEHTKDYVVMDFIEGTLIGKYLETASPAEREAVFEKMLQQLRKLDILKFNKFELTNPYKHIIVKADGTPILIDFERAKYTSRPKNVNQFEEYIKKFSEN